MTHTIASVIAAAALTFGIATEVAAAPVNINKASAQEIADALTGIGLKKAREIVQFREVHGPFRSADQLRDIKGIGPKMLEKNRANIRLQ